MPHKRALVKSMEPVPSPAMRPVSLTAPGGLPGTFPVWRRWPLRCSRPIAQGGCGSDDAGRGEDLDPLGEERLTEFRGRRDIGHEVVGLSEVRDVREQLPSVLG